MNKILFVSNYYSEFLSAGTSQRTKDIKKGLSTKGWECRVITIFRKKIPIPKEPDIKDIIYLSALSERYPVPLQNISTLFSEIRKSEIVHIIDHWSALNLFSVIFCFLSKTPYIYSPCGALKPFGRNIYLKKIYNLIFLRFILFNASSIFAVTNNELDEIRFLFKKKLNVHLFPNGVWTNKEIVHDDLQFEKLKSQFKLPKKYLLYVGRLSFIKGPDLLLKAFMNFWKNVNYEIIFAGPDDNMMFEMLKKINDSKLMQKVHFLGMVSPFERDLLIKNAFLTVIPSRREAMSMIALESALMGTPFLATNCCGLEEFINHSAGFICQPDSNSIQEVLLELLLNPKKVNKVGVNAKEYVHSNFDWDLILREMSITLKNFLN